MGTLLMLVRLNFPRFLGIGAYGITAIILAVLCYVIFSKLLSLNTGLDATSQDSLLAVILAVGIIVAMSIVVAATGYEPAPPPHIPGSFMIHTSSGKLPVGSGCGSGCSTDKKPRKRIRRKLKTKPPGGQIEKQNE